VSDLESVIELIQTGKRFLITSHENPDGDAIGSMLALGLALRGLGKYVSLYNKDGAPRLLSFLPGSEEIDKELPFKDGSFDATFVVDCSDTSRAGDEFERFKSTGRCGTIVIIDHHDTSKPSAHFYILDPKAPSTGIVVYSLLKTMALNITPEIATNIYTTIVVDTGSFRYQNTLPEAFEIAAELVRIGANPWEVSKALYESESVGKLRLLALVLQTLEVSEDGRIASVVVRKDMFKLTGTTKEDTEGLVNFPRSIGGVEVAVLFREEEYEEEGMKWKVSLRSKGKVNVAKIGEKFGGGGHEKAAGCTVFGSLSEVKQRIFSSIIDSLEWME